MKANGHGSAPPIEIGAPVLSPLNAADFLTLPKQNAARENVFADGVAPIPWRVAAAERLLIGQKVTASLAVAIAGANPLARTDTKCRLRAKLWRAALCRQWRQHRSGSFLPISYRTGFLYNNMYATNHQRDHLYEFKGESGQRPGAGGRSTGNYHRPTTQVRRRRVDSSQRTCRADRDGPLTAITSQLEAPACGVASGRTRPGKTLYSNTIAEGDTR